MTQTLKAKPQISDFLFGKKISSGLKSEGTINNPNSTEFYTFTRDSASGFSFMSAFPALHPPMNPNPQFQGGVESEEVITLLVRHLPEAVPHDTLTRLFSQYGASSVRPCSGGRLRNCAFVDFRNEALASRAQHQLNGLRFLGRVLQVQRASKPNENKKLQLTEAQPGKEFSKFTSVAKDTDLAKENTDGSKSGSPTTNEPIAEKLGVNYPFPPHLEYVYPPPDANILTNITNALIAVPRLYTQVLHLMNKMNLPPPFRMALPTPPLPSSVHTAQPQPPLPPPTDVKADLGNQSSSESEMESDENVIASEKGRKRSRLESIVGPAVDKRVSHESVGVKTSTLTPKEMPLIKKNNPVLQIKINPKVTVDEVKEDEEKEPVEESKNIKQFATQEELESGKLPPEEILSLPMFKNYTAGNPAPVLYIKNLSKDVIQDDFYYIFGSIFGSTDAAKAALGIRLMQEGRMRGQAFVTFPSIELAHHALNLVNGYVFKGKPIIVQFGRNPAASKPT